jgi:hypothetical protein
MQKNSNMIFYRKKTILIHIVWNERRAHVRPTSYLTNRIQWDLSAASGQAELIPL